MNGNPPGDWRGEYLALSNKTLFPTRAEVLQSLPTELHTQWESYMRGKTCPIIAGQSGVYPWDLPGFLKVLPTLKP